MDSMEGYAEPSQDERWMKAALSLAQAAAERGEVPVGAVVIYQGAIVGEGANSTITLHDPTAHAEVIALRAAAEALGNYRLSDCEMFATLEPCAMCAGALIHSRVSRLVYAAADPKAGAAGSVLSVINHPQLNHQMVVEAGLLGEEAGAMLREFFRARRRQAEGA
jgi:tRNA(adenine34) deaminase